MKNEKNDNSIVFLNKPISTREEDVIGFDAHIDSIRGAINKGANIIGIISDYGTGKSSIVDIMSSEEEDIDCISINMWDSLEEKKSDRNGTLSTLIKSFVYQLGKKKKESIGNHVNKMLSNNYSIFSFSVGYKKFWVCLTFALLLISLFFVSGSTKNAEVISSFLKWNVNTVKFYLLITRIVSLIAAFILIVIGLGGTHLMFSRIDKNGKRKTDVNEVFAAYSYVYKKLEEKKKTTVVVIEDLDRVNDDSEAKEFLKQLYRINNICEKRKKRNQPVFVVAISKNRMNNDDIFSKLFDYEITLNGVHIDDFRDVLGDILNKDKVNKQRLMALLFKDEAQEARMGNEEKLLNYCNWLYKGESLTIRELKDRLNKTIEKYCDLKNKGYQSVKATNFETCAAIVYLENQYPNHYYKLVNEEKDFDKFIDETYNILREDKSNQKDRIKTALEKIDIFNDNGDESSEDFIEDLSEMVIKRLIDHEYRMYFYAYPKGSYIKSSDEKDICNYLELPNKYKYDESTIKEKVENVINEEKVLKIEETIKNIASNDSIESYSEIVFEHKYLFGLSVRYGKDKTIVSAINLVRNNYPGGKAKRLLTQLSSFENYNEEFQQQYIDKICEEFSTLNPVQIIDMRIKLVDAFKDNIIEYKKLFIESDEHNAPLLSKAEIELIDDNKISVELVDVNNIGENDADYIQDLICDVGSFEDYKEELIEIQKRIVNRAGFEDVQEKVLSFMTSSEVTDVYLFELACDQVKKDELESEKLAEYINSLDLDIIPEEYYREIDGLVKYIRISDVVLDRLISKGFYNTALVVCAQDNKLNHIDFFKENEEVNIIDSIARINNNYPGLIYTIREHIVRHNEKSCLDKYESLFFVNLNIISKRELEAISDYKIALELIDFGRIDSTNYGEIIEYINSDIREGEECYLTMYNLLTKVKMNTAGMIEMIGSIDYEQVKMSSLDENEKGNIVAWMKQKNILRSSGEDARKWMLKMKTVTESLEKLVISDLGNKAYNEMIDDIGELSDYSKTQIEGRDPGYAYCDDITNEFLADGCKEHYIVGKILKHNSFEYPMQGVADDDLIVCYREDWPIMDYLQGNESFMNSVWHNKKYSQFEHITWRSIEPFTKYEQTGDFFDFVIQIGDNEIIKKYFSTLNTIVSAEDSNYIADRFLSGTLFCFIENDIVFEHIKEQLWENSGASKGKKGALTRKYNEYKSKRGPINIS